MMSDQYANKLLGMVGTAVARENGFPFSRLEWSEEVTCPPMMSASSLHLGEAYFKASDECESLRTKAKAKGLVVDFSFGHGKPPLLVQTSYEDHGGAELTKYGIGKKTVRRTHYFEVEGYRSRKESLLENMDRLLDISEVEKTMEPKEKPKLAFGLLDELYGHHNVEELYGKKVNPTSYKAEPFVMKNSATLLSLDMEETYSEMRKLAEGERQAKMKELEGSFMANVLGNWYRQAKESKIRHTHHETLKKISKMEYVLLSKNPSPLASQGL